MTETYTYTETRERCLITGAAGSIGCHVLMHFLHNTDWDIVTLDSYRHKGILDRIDVMLDAHPEFRSRVTCFYHDFNAPVSEILAGRIGHIDRIINIASLSDVHDSIVNPVPFVTNNVNLILNVLEYARRFPELMAFMQLSSDEVYGPTDGKSFHKEWDPIVPSNPYSASKAAQEAIAISYWRTYNVPLIIVNLMNNFGEMQSPAKFPAIVQRKLRAGETITVHASAGHIGSRFYIHSRNSADAFLHILTKCPPPWMHEEGQMDKPDRYNIVGDKQISNVELVELIAKCLDKPADYVIEDSKVTRPGHDAHYGLDGEKLAHAGWKSPVSLEDSMEHVVSWYEENPEWLNPK
jgi:dTDP-glucose 4,6-dehydratase